MLLNDKQITFLSRELTKSNDVMPSNVAIALSKINTMEELYEYLEDFADIKEPWFDIVLDLALKGSDLEHKLITNESIDNDGGHDPTYG